MTINDRIKQLRNNLNWSQKQLAANLGITQSGVSYMEQSGSTVAESTIKTICSICDVSEDWLRNGIGDMHKKTDTFNLSAFAKSHGMTDLEQEILKVYFELDPKIRNEVLTHFRDRLVVGPVTSDSVGSPTGFPIVTEREILLGDNDTDVDEVG